MDINDAWKFRTSDRGTYRLGDVLIYYNICIYRLTEMNSKEYLEQHRETIAEKSLQTQGDEIGNGNLVFA